MVRREEALQLLREALNTPSADFRPDQWESIDDLVNHNRRVHVIQRTGWGKSSVYFLSIMLLREQRAGIAIIISPLLALIRNQVESARKFGLVAESINSSNTAEWSDIEQRVVEGKVDVLFISPERLANEGFMQRVMLSIADRVNLFVVDESHCISDWGHDFRVDYRRIVNILSFLPPTVSIIATTATANDRVVADVSRQLGELSVRRGTLRRDSLRLQNIRLKDQPSRLVWLAEALEKIEGTGIIYTLTKRDVKNVTDWLRQRGHNVMGYYSGVVSDDFPDTNDYRLHLEDSLQHNEVKALVSTVALGMGYDKPDLAFVIHFQAPGSLIGYYQQVGRAGRGISEAIGILLSGDEDEVIHDFFRRSAFPPKATVDKILYELEEAEAGLSVNQLAQKLNQRIGKIEHALKYLSVEINGPVVKIGSKWNRVASDYVMDLDKIQRLTLQRKQEWEQVEDYLTTTDCLMRYLQIALDDPNPTDCGRCANCTGDSLVVVENNESLGVTAAQFLRRSDILLNLRAQIPAQSLMQTRELLEITGDRQARIPMEYRGQIGRTLSKWKDAGWGKLVAQGKHARHFDDQLVQAVYDMILRWQPDPFPTWVTCVPSHNSPTLVADFAERLSKVMGLPFVLAVNKVTQTEPQKLQENSFHQSNNIDGAFAVAEEKLLEGPVLLIDDAVDSGWTLTVISALLLCAGSGPVFPLALTSTNLGS